MSEQWIDVVVAQEDIELPPATHEVCMATPFGAERLFGPAPVNDCNRFKDDIAGRYEARTFVRPLVGTGT